MQSCLLWCCGLSLSFPNVAPECCMLNKIYLFICAFVQGTAASVSPQCGTVPGEVASFLPVLWGLQDQAPRGWDKQLPV